MSGATASFSSENMKLYIRLHRVAAVVLAAIALALAGANAAAAGTQTGGVVLVLGDSLSAGYGLSREQGWVFLLQERLRKTHPAYEVVNASISGDTSRGGQARLPKLLKRLKVSVAVVELGGNDGLRGIVLKRTKAHLADMIEALKAHGAKVVLAGMQIPPNLGPRYTREFKALYPELAAKHQVALIPFLLEGVADKADLMQSDGIHPTAKAQPLLLDNVWPHLEPLL